MVEEANLMYGNLKEACAKVYLYDEHVLTEKIAHIYSDGIKDKSPS